MGEIRIVRPCKKKVFLKTGTRTTSQGHSFELDDFLFYVLFNRFSVTFGNLEDLGFFWGEVNRKVFVQWNLVYS